MRRLLGVLREDAGVEPADARPQPGLRQLNDLIDEAREASERERAPDPARPAGHPGPGVELAAYRIIQEALTNARRHAPGAAVDVEMHFMHGELRLPSGTTARARPRADAGPARARPARHARACRRRRRRAADRPGASGGFHVEATGRRLSSGPNAASPAASSRTGDR